MGAGIQFFLLYEIYSSAQHPQGWSKCIYSGLTKSRGFAWPQVLCTGPVGIFSVVSRFDALERKCEKSLGVEVQIVRQPARRSDGFAIPRPDGLRFADRRNRL